MEISILLDKNYSLREIARALGRSISTISDEIKRNSINVKYNPTKAQHKSYVRRKNSKYQGRKIVLDSNLRSFIEHWLYDDQSPGRNVS